MKINKIWILIVVIGIILLGSGIVIFRISLKEETKKDEEILDKGYICSKSYDLIDENVEYNMILEYTFLSNDSKISNLKLVNRYVFKSKEDLERLESRFNGVKEKLIIEEVKNPEIDKVVVDGKEITLAEKTKVFLKELEDTGFSCK